MSSTNWAQLIKQNVKETLEALKMCDFTYATVENVKPLTLKIDQKTTITQEFLSITETIKKLELKKGETLIVIRKTGGQNYAVIDRV